VDWGFGQYIINVRIEGEKDLIRIPIKASKIDETILIKDYAMGETPQKLPKKIPKGMKDA